MNEIQVMMTTSPGVLSMNFDDLEAGLALQMTAYDGLTVTAENYQERKADVATLRKIRAAIDDRRKQAKKEYEAPLKEFEAKVKRLTGIVDNQIDTINAGLTAVEDARRAEKQMVVNSLYEQEVGELADFLPLRQIMKDKWLNKTCKESEIIFDLQEMTRQVKTDLQAIRNLGAENEDRIIDAYKRGGNSLPAAMQAHANYMQAKADAEKHLREEAERKAREEAERKAREAAVTPPEPPAPATAPKEPQNAAVGRVTASEWTVTILGAEDIKAARAYFEMFGIRYREE